MKRKEQLIKKRRGYQRPQRSGGHITEDRGPEKQNRDNGEGEIGDHGLKGRAGRLQGRECGRIKTECGRIKTGCGEIEWNSGENRHGGVGGGVGAGRAR